MKFRTKEQKNYVAASIRFSTALMFISAFIVFLIVGIFFYRLVSKDYTVTSFRQIHIELITDWDKLRASIPKDSLSHIYSIRQNTLYNKDAYLYNKSGEFILHNAPLPVFVFIHYWDAATFALFFWFFYLLRKLLLSLESNNPFTSENIQLLKKISYIITWTPLIDSIALQNFFHFLLKDVRFQETTIAAYHFHLLPLVAILFLGHLFFAIIKAFEKGLIIKEENDLTV